MDRCLQAFAPSQSAKEDILLALVEALSNAYASSVQAPAGRRITVSLTVSPRFVRLTIKDSGRGFRRRDTPAALVPAEREAGRGLFLIERLMDRVSWSATGSAIRMERRWRRLQAGSLGGGSARQDPPWAYVRRHQGA